MKQFITFLATPDFCVFVAARVYFAEINKNMGQKSRRKKNKKWTRSFPDEVFQRGPLKIERYGRFLRFSNSSSPEQHAEVLEHFEEQNKKVLQELPQEIEKLQLLITRYDPLELMQRAAYMILPLFMKYTSENEYKSDEAYFLPTVEYIQYLIARTSPNTDGKSIAEEEWIEIWDQATKVMRLTQSYLFSRKASANPPSEMDGLGFFLDNKRLGIRVKRYPFFLQRYWRSSLKPYEQWIKQLHGVGVEEIIKGLSEIDVYQKTGFIDRYRQTSDATRDLMEKLQKKGLSVQLDAPAEELEKTKMALDSEEFRSLYEDTQEKARLTFTPAIFDITEVTSLPKSVLSFLSVKPGESVLTQFENPDHDDLSPLSNSIFHYKPFLEVSGRFYTFYHSGFEDRIAEIIESDLYQKFPNKTSELTKKRSEEAELTSKNLLVSLINPDFVYQNVYYPNPDEVGGLTELDILLGVDDILFLVEVKAGGFSDAASRGAPTSMKREFSELIIKGQRQSERAEKYIKSAPQVDFFDRSGRRVVSTVKRGDFRKIFRVVVTREDLGWVGAHIAVLSVLDPGLSRSFPWHVSIDDLRIVEELFKNSETRFVHFLEQRLRASAETTLSQHDEVEHIALYYHLNQYYDLPFKGADRATFDASYMHDIDAYFVGKVTGESVELPAQILPEKTKALLNAIKESGLAGRFEISSMILSAGDEGRKVFEDALGTLTDGIKMQKLRSARLPFSEASYGFTVTYIDDQRLRKELAISAALMQQGRYNVWVVIQLDRDTLFRVKTINKISPDMFSEEELVQGKLHLEESMAKIIAKEGIGRNDKCPCASGKKYKRCHGL